MVSRLWLNVNGSRQDIPSGPGDPTYDRYPIKTILKLVTRNGPNIGEGHNLVAPVFLLFLDCVFQIHTQFPCSFEFSPGLLVVLADHSSSSNFGTFLWDCEKERRDGRVREQTVSLWSFLNQVEILSQHLNCLYLPQPTVIWPSVAPMSLGLWSGYFLRWVQVRQNKCIFAMVCWKALIHRPQ